LHARAYPDFAASRAYYAAFYAATALLLHHGLEAGKHSGVLALVHQHFVKTGRLPTAQGKVLNWLFELRGIADYGAAEHVSAEEAEKAIASADGFLAAVTSMLVPKS
jgi:uncharacterized protein (UPF0332 family)